MPDEVLTSLAYGNCPVRLRRYVCADAMCRARKDLSDFSLHSLVPGVGSWFA